MSWEKVMKLFKKSDKFLDKVQKLADQAKKEAKNFK